MRYSYSLSSYDVEFLNSASSMRLCSDALFNTLQGTLAKLHKAVCNF